MMVGIHGKEISKHHSRVVWTQRAKHQQMQAENSMFDCGNRIGLKICKIYL